MEKRMMDALAAIVGQANVSDALMDLVAYSYDFSEYRSRPVGAVWPTSTKQVSEILKWADEERVPVVPRGAGTGATGMVVPIAGGIIIDLLKMNRILRISIEDRVAVVQPGVIYADLQKALEPYGFFYPPDPASGHVATLGGNVATGAGGLKGAKYGTTRDYVLALEIVIPGGQIMRVGSPCMKSVSGYDMTRLLVGSEGTLAIITEITFKINPKPLAASTALAFFQELKQAGRAVSEIMYSGIIPSVCELLDGQCIDLLIDETGLAAPRSSPMILVETDGYTKEEADFQMKRIMEVFRRNNAVDVKQASSAAEAESLWKARKTVGIILTAVAPNFVVEDATVPISKITDLIEGMEAISRQYQIRIVSFGHAGDGNLHPHLFYDARNPQETERMKKALADLFTLACRLGGTLTGEHGIGLCKAPFMSLEHAPAAMKMMSSLKKVFDPHNILNPGKMGLEH